MYDEIIIIFIKKNLQRICIDTAVYELQVNFTYSKIHDPKIWASNYMSYGRNIR